MFPPSIILRHRKENLKKCSLRGLETRPDMLFYSYPKELLFPPENYFVLSMDGPPLSKADAALGIFLIDGTWAYADKMLKAACPPDKSIKFRSLAKSFRTAYPRKQTACSDPQSGLASIEALYISYFLLGRDLRGFLDNYYWKEKFLDINTSLALD